MLPEPTTGASKTPNPGFGTPQARVELPFGYPVVRDRRSDPRATLVKRGRPRVSSPPGRSGRCHAPASRRTNGATPTPLSSPRTRAAAPHPAPAQARQPTTSIDLRGIDTRRSSPPSTREAHRCCPLPPDSRSERPTAGALPRSRFSWSKRPSAPRPPARSVLVPSGRPPPRGDDDRSSTYAGASAVRWISCGVSDQRGRQSRRGAA